MQDLENAHRSPELTNAGEGSSLDPGGELAYAVGVVNHRSYADLERCLASLREQRPAPAAVVVVDADSDPVALARLRALHPEVAWLPAENRGFAGGANAAVARLEADAPGARYLLLLNPDVELEPGFARELVVEVARHPDVALATGKLLRPDDGRIDSAGMSLSRHRRPRDRGSREPDRGRYERVEYVFGASGSALLLRRAALDDLRLEGELFDEDFFAYYEDADLAWRAQLLGWRVLYVPAARALHGRRWRRERRFEIEAAVRRHSFKNHYLQIAKNERARDFALHLPWIAAWEVLRLLFALLRDPAVLGGYRDAWRLRRRTWRKRRLLQARARQGRASRSLSRRGV